MTDATYRTKPNDQIDEICWRHYGRTSEVVEKVLEANPGLADKGPLLPGDLLIHLPGLSENKQAAAIQKTIRIWD